MVTAPLHRSHELLDGAEPMRDISSADWEAVMTALQGAAASVVFDDQRVGSPFLRAEGLRYLCRLFVGGWNTLVEPDPAYPQLARLESPILNWLWPNPDYDYLT